LIEVSKILLMTMDIGTFRLYTNVPTDAMFYIVLPGKFEQNNFQSIFLQAQIKLEQNVVKEF